MALTVGTITSGGDHSFQANFVHTFEVACDDDYPGTEGGYDLDAVLDVAGKLKDHVVVAVVAHPFYDSVGTTGYYGVWDPATNLLAIHTQADGAPVANAADLSGIDAMKLTVWTE